MPDQVVKPISPRTRLTVSAPPHVHCGRTVRLMTIETILALLPAVCLAIFHLGLPAARVMALSVATAVVVEHLAVLVMDRRSSIWDWHAVLTGLIFAFLLPSQAPWWLVICGSAVTMLLGKMAFGGLGGNPLNPAALGWAVCRISWPQAMSPELTVLDTPFTSAVADLKYFGVEAAMEHGWGALLLGKQLGGLGSVQVLALLLGGLYLVARRHIRPDIPFSFLAGVALMALVFNLADPGLTAGPLFHIVAGSAVFGAFFLAPDCASSPVGHAPMIVYGLLGGLLVVLIRVYGIYPDAVPFAVILANLFSPLLDRIRPKAMGKR